MPDHVHLCVELPPKYAVSDFMGYLKGKSALQIFDRHTEFKERGDKEFWARGYYVDHHLKWWSMTFGVIEGEYTHGKIRVFLGIAR